MQIPINIFQSSTVQNLGENRAFLPIGHPPHIMFLVFHYIFMTIETVVQKNPEIIWCQQSCHYTPI